MADTLAPAAPVRTPLRFAEFVPLVAALMAVGALGVDSMLPALPEIGRDLHLPNQNAQQLVIYVYLLGLGVGQLIHGPLSDRFGRKPVLAANLAIAGVGAVLCAAAHSFVLLLAARLAAGLAVAATRVVTIAIVRDCFAGRAMARVMSLAAMVFLVVPVLAPTIGQGILLFGNWRTIFGVVAGFAVLVLTWFWLRMGETLHPEDRQPLTGARLAAGWRITLGNRASLGYTLATALLQGVVFAYVGNVQPIVADTYHRPKLLNIVFAVTAGTMAAGNLLNSRLVMRLGSRLLSHSALCLLAALGYLALIAQAAGLETLLVFTVIQALTLGALSLTSSNFQSMAMADMGHIAGAASSIQGFISVTAGTLIGLGIGQLFAGTTVPLHAGAALGGTLALAIVAITERGRLFRPAEPAPAAPRSALETEE